MNCVLCRLRDAEAPPPQCTKEDVGIAVIGAVCNDGDLLLCEQHTLRVRGWIQVARRRARDAEVTS